MTPDIKRLEKQTIVSRYEEVRSKKVGSIT